jgi:hypothetical protein
MNLRSVEEENKGYKEKFDDMERDTSDAKGKYTEGQKLVNRLYEEREKVIEDHQRLAMICDEKIADNEKKTAIVGKLQMKLFLALAELSRVTKGQANPVDGDM